MHYPLGSVQSFQQQSQSAAQLNGVQHDELLQNLTPSNNNISVNNVNSTAGHTALQIQAQSLSAQQSIIPVDQLASVAANQKIGVNDLESLSVTALQNEIEQNDVIAQASADIEHKDDLSAIQSEQNSINDNHANADDLSSKAIQNEPKTYAQFFKSDNFGSGINFVSSSSASSGRTPNTANTLNTRSQSTRTGGPVRVERRSSNANQFSDNHQLFLGNVPHHATEEELKIMFGRFGTVIDLRIHSKPGSKIPGGRAPQNYGFITYEDPESVQNCLANMPLYYPENSSDSQKLNVEEKKARMRNENSNNIDRNDRDRGLGRNISGNQRNSGDRDRGIGLSRTSNARLGGGGNRPFNRNDRQQGPRGNNNPSNSASAGNGGGGGYGRR